MRKFRSCLLCMAILGLVVATVVANTCEGVLSGFCTNEDIGVGYDNTSWVNQDGGSILSDAHVQDGDGVRCFTDEGDLSDWLNTDDLIYYEGMGTMAFSVGDIINEIYVNVIAKDEFAATYNGNYYGIDELRVRLFKYNDLTSTLYWMTPYAEYATPWSTSYATYTIGGDPNNNEWSRNITASDMDMLNVSIACRSDSSQDYCNPHIDRITVDVDYTPATAVIPRNTKMYRYAGMIEPVGPRYFMAL